MRRRIDDEMDRLGNQGRQAERNQMRYEYAMEDAQKAERKGRWEVPKRNTKKALRVHARRCRGGSRIGAGQPCVGRH